MNTKNTMTLSDATLVMVWKHEQEIAALHAEMAELKRSIGVPADTKSSPKTQAKEFDYEVYRKLAKKLGVWNAKAKKVNKDDREIVYSAMRKLGYDC